MLENAALILSLRFNVFTNFVNLPPGGKTKKRSTGGRLHPEVQLHTVFMQFFTEKATSIKKWYPF